MTDTTNTDADRLAALEAEVENLRAVTPGRDPMLVRSDEQARANAEYLRADRARQREATIRHRADAAARRLTQLPREAERAVAALAEAEAKR